MVLKSLGSLSLENISLPRTPLLVLAYLLHHPDVSRSSLGTMFWPSKPKAVQTKNLSEVLRKLESVEALSRKPSLYFHAKIDSEQFYEYYTSDPKEAARLYKGDFLQGIEDDKRYIPSEELLAWIESTRQKLQLSALELFIRLSENILAQGSMNEAKTYILEAYKLCNRLVPNRGDYERIYHLLLAIGARAEVESLLTEYRDIFQEALNTNLQRGDFNLSSVSSNNMVLENIKVVWLGAIEAQRNDLLHATILGLERQFDNAAKVDEGLDLVDKGLASTLVLNDEILKAKLLASKAWFLLRLGKHTESVRTAKLALTKLPLHITYSRRTCLNALGANSDMAGEFIAASDYFYQAKKLCKEGISEYAIATMNLALNSINQGRYTDALQQLEIAHEIFNREQRHVNLASHANALGRCYFELGNFALSQQVLEEAIEVIKEKELMHWQIILELRLAQAMAGQGNYVDAKTLCEQNLKTTISMNATTSVITSYSILGDIEFSLSNWQQAYTNYHIALQKSYQGSQSTNQAVSLHRFVQLIPVYRQLNIQDISDHLYGFCIKPCNQKKMFASTQRLFQQLIEPKDVTPKNISKTFEEITSMVLE